MSSLEDKLRYVAQNMEGDPWSSSLRKLSSPEHEIIPGNHVEVCLYLANLKMLWRLGVKGISVADKLRVIQAAPGDDDEEAVDFMLTTLGETADSDADRLKSLRNSAKQILAAATSTTAKTLSATDRAMARLARMNRATKASPTIRLVES